jgi:hypothetical protein
VARCGVSSAAPRSLAWGAALRHGARWRDQLRAACNEQPGRRAWLLAAWSGASSMAPQGLARATVDCRMTWSEASSMALRGLVRGGSNPAILGPAVATLGEKIRQCDGGEPSSGT